MPKKALIAVDVQNDFIPGGALSVPEGDAVVPILNRYIEKFDRAGLPVYATRDWHPGKTVHFKAYGGIWPEHCVQGSEGAKFHPDLKLPENAEIISKGTDPEAHGYSAFEGANDQGETLAESLRKKGIDDIYIGGLATDYCVRTTAFDAQKQGLRVTVLADAIKGVDVNPGDSEKALKEMKEAGVEMTTLDEVSV